MNALPAIPLNAHNCAFANFRKCIEDSFDIFGMNIQSFGCDNHVFFSAAVVEPAFGIDLTKITGVQPTPIGSRDAFAADQDLAVRRDPYILAFDDFSERSG